jgi:uncharacterized protein
MPSTDRHPVVHLELHTGNLSRACDFYTRLLGWHTETIATDGARAYQALDLGRRVDGGVVECGTQRALWLPYVEVADVRDTTGHARDLGASVWVEPREGPAGWRSVVASPAGAEIAFWQPK